MLSFYNRSHDLKLRFRDKRPGYETKSQDLARTTGSFQGETHPRIAADEISTCRS